MRAPALIVRRELSKIEGFRAIQVRVCPHGEHCTEHDIVVTGMPITTPGVDPEEWPYHAVLTWGPSAFLSAEQSRLFAAGILAACTVAENIMLEGDYRE